MWEKQFGNSQERWLRAVADDLRDWGFNTIGWTQEVVIIKDGYQRHSRAFTYEEYQWAGMPYCHLLSRGTFAGEGEALLPYALRPPIAQERLELRLHYAGVLAPASPWRRHLAPMAFGPPLHCPRA